VGEFRIGCQTITWGEGQSGRLTQVFREASAAGYEGTEIGFRHIRSTPPSELKAMLGVHGLALIGTHIGGNLLDPGSAGEEQSLIDAVLDYLVAAGGSLLMYSGLRHGDPAAFSRDLATLRAAGDRCAQSGVRLLYHNHDWELGDAPRVIEFILEHAPEVGLCPDLGWLMKGGANVVRFLDHTQDRIGALHFKDFASADRAKGGADATLLGEGIVPLREAAEWARANLPGMWFIAEQDNAIGSPLEAVTANARFLRGVTS